MKSTSFIQKKLKELYSYIDEIKIRYEYRKISSCHIIEIIPLSVFDQQEEYITFETNFENEFDTLFPDENILFVSEKSLTEIENVDLSFGYSKFKFNNTNKELALELHTENVGIDYYNDDCFALAA